MPAPMPALVISPSNVRGWLRVAFKYHPGLVEVVRRLPTRKFDADSKTWEFEASQAAVQKLQGTGAHITLEPAAEALWLRGGGRPVSSTQSAPALGPVKFKLDVKGSKAEKKPLPEDFKFITLPMIKQRECMEYLCANPKFYLNMDVGTGKTKIYIDRARLGSHRAKRPMLCLIVGPNNKIPDYGKNELPKHAGVGNFEFFDARGGEAKWNKALKLAGLAMQKHAGKFPFIVMIGLNWESLRRRTKALPPRYFDVLLLDEAHCGKSPSSDQGKAAKTVASSTPVVLEGSGTACPQGPSDLWNQVTMLMPHLLPSDFTSHKRRYEIQELVELPGTAATEDRPGKAGRRFLQTTGYQNLYELRDIFSQCSFSATQEDCLDLPGVIPERRYVIMHAETRKAYEDIRKHGVLLLSPTSICLADNAGVEMLRAQQVCGGFIGLTDFEGRSTGNAVPVPGPNAKLDYTVKELVPELMESKAGRQIVVWAYGRAELRALELALAGVEFTDPATSQKRALRVCSLWGDTPKAAREVLDTEFRAGKYDLLVSNPQSGGTGMEFQTADVEIWYSRGFKLIHRQQGEGRLNRYGQKNKVLRIDLLYEDSLEDYVLEVLESKRDLQDLLTSNPRAALKQAFQDSL